VCARSTAAFINANREGIKLAHHVARALARVFHEAVQAPRAGAPFQYVTDAA